MDPADFYTGVVVDAYARLRSTTFDAAPYAAFVRAHGEPGLELGCGDGAPMLDLCAAGLAVDGVDSSADMVERCRRHAEERGLRTTVVRQRMEDLDLPTRYRSVYLAGPTFNLLPDDATARRALAAIGRHLADDGALLVPLWVPGPTPEHDLGRTRTAAGGPGVELRYTPVSETYDRATRTRVTTARYERVTPEGTEVADRAWVLHWWAPDAFVGLCEAAGLVVLEAVDDDGGPATEASTSYVVTAARVPAA